MQDTFIRKQFAKFQFGFVPQIDRQQMDAYLEAIDSEG